MNVLETAEKYAEGKANQAITKAIADAYIEGYKAGNKDREEEKPMEPSDNKTEYVDLGLPSGTLWASDYEKLGGKYVYLPYEKANRMNLPTEKQWQELKACCKMEYDDYNSLDRKYNEVIFIGPNGNSITFTNIAYVKAKLVNSDEILFWLQNNGGDSENNAVSINIKEINKKLGPIKCFTGFKLPIRLVR